MNELTRDLILVFAGWFLGFLTTSVDSWRKSRNEYQILFGRCYRLIKELAIDLAVSETWDSLGGIHSLKELFIEPSSNEKKLPPSPPYLSDDFQDILDRLFEYEATRPKSAIGYKFATTKDQVNTLNQVYAGLEVASKIPDGELPEKALRMYKDTWKELQENLPPILRELDYQRSSYFVRPFILFRRKWKQLKVPKQAHASLKTPDNSTR